MEPPRRFSYSASSAGGGDASYAGSRRVSCTDSCRILSNYNMGSSFGTDDYFMETEDENEDNWQQQNEERIGHRKNRSKYSSAKHKRTDSTKSKSALLEVPGMVCSIFSEILLVY